MDDLPREELIQEWEQYLSSLDKDSSLSKEQIVRAIIWWSTAKEKFPSNIMPPHIAKVSLGNNNLVFIWENDSKVFQIEFLPSYAYCHYMNNRTGSASYFKYTQKDCNSWIKLGKVLNYEL